MLAHEDYKTQKGNLTQSIGALSLEEKRKLAKNAAGTMQGDIAGREAGTEQRYNSLTKRHGKAGALAQSLGLDMTEEELGMYKGLDEKQGIRAIMEKAGLGKDDKLVGKVLETMTSGSSGSQATGLKGLLANLNEGQRAELKKNQKDMTTPEVKALTNIEKYTKNLEDIKVTMNAIKDKGSDMGGGDAESQKKSTAKQPGG